jgi:hypothetical protein
MQDRAFANEKIVFRWDTTVNEVLGDTKVIGPVAATTVTGEDDELALSGVFVAIGHVPNSGIFAGQLDVDEAGYIRTTTGSRTNVDGCLRLRRRPGPRLPAGRHGRRFGLYGGHRRRTLARGRRPRLSRLSVDPRHGRTRASAA